MFVIITRTVYQDSLRVWACVTYINYMNLLWGHPLIVRVSYWVVANHGYMWSMLYISRRFWKVIFQMAIDCPILYWFPKDNVASSDYLRPMFEENKLLFAIKFVVSGFVTPATILHGFTSTTSTCVLSSTTNLTLSNVT